jgi:hypothetical protein
MAVYDHNLEIDGDSNEIKILCNGEVRYWKVKIIKLLSKFKY